MNDNDLLERRADRGIARGASIVWADAQLDSSPSRPPDRSNLLLRVALVAFVLGLAWVVFDRVRPDADAQTADQPEEQPSDDPTEPLPDPILIEGMELVRVTRPFDSDFDGGGVFDRLGLSEQREPIFDDLDPGHTTVVFADKIDPFGNPILGVELFDAGGFLAWTANLGDLTVEDLTENLEQRNGAWTMTPDSGMIEVARFEDEPYSLVQFGWEFEFANNNDRVVVHAESIDRDTDLDEWIWIARLAAETEGVRVSRLGILDEPGVVIDVGPVDGDDVVWLREDFVYRLNAFTQNGNDLRADRASELKEQLRVVERSVWLEAVDGAERRSAMEWFTIAVYVLTVLASVVIVAVHLLRRRKVTATG